MRLQGKAWKFGDNISTDHIAPGRLFHLRSNLPELAKHVLEDADPEFASKVQPGDFVVAETTLDWDPAGNTLPPLLRWLESVLSWPSPLPGSFSQCH